MSISANARTLYLPNTLLLLVHLHLLEYPYSNRPEYDHNVFKPRTRGLRERARAMEDVSYFLVGKLEGKGIKTILASYPCSQPSESLAFRTTLTKYLENLRHHCIYPTSARSVATSSKSKTPNEISDNVDYAWWWKDVIVRKSLLEECSGDKFERLMLSLSTHTLMRSFKALNPDMMSELLRSQPAMYSNSLAQCQTSRHAWAKSASLIMSAQVDLKMLCSRIQSQVSTKCSKYDSMTTDRLKALAQATLQELLQRKWEGESGKAALFFLIELAALKLSSTTVSSDKRGQAKTSTIASAVPSPLPIAAAHHPTHLKRLRRPIFATKTKASTNTDDVPALPSRSHTEIIMAEHLAAQRRIHQALKDALSCLEKRGIELKEKYDAIMSSHSSETSAPVSAISFWAHSSATTTIDCTPKVGKDFMFALGFQVELDMLDQDTGDEDALEKRIEEIRRTVLPPYPSLPDLSAPRLPPRDLKPTATSGKTSVIDQKQNQSLASASSRIPKSVSIINLPIPTINLPVPPAMSPGKSSRSERRKSVRFSMAQRQTGRASMFRVFSGEVNEEVSKLVDETHDFPTDDEDTEDGYASPYKTPRGKGKQKINRIWTAGAPASAKRSAATPKQSSAYALFLNDEPKQRLPSLAFSVSYASCLETGGSDADSDADDRNDGVRDGNATPRPREKSSPRRSSIGSTESENDDYKDEDGDENIEAGDQDAFDDDPPSMTLKEILLSAADTSHFDLLGADDVDQEVLAADASFVWD